MYWTIIRPIKNCVFNWWYRKRRKKLPRCTSIEHANEVLREVKWTKDRTDWQKHPELTWGEKKGDCEDIAKLSAELIRLFVIKCKILNFIATDWGHAICWYPNGVFNNGKLRYTTESWAELAYRIGGNEIKEIIVENPYTGKIEERIKI